VDGEARNEQQRPSRLGVWLCWAAPGTFLLARLVATQFADPDLWGRISVGAVFAQAGHLPRIDDFSWLARGEAWVDHEWLTGVVLYAVLAAVGETGLHLLKYALALLALAAVFFLHGRVYRTGQLLGAYALTLSVPLYLLGFGSTLRSQVFSFVFFLFFIVLLESVRLGRSSTRQLAWLPLAGIVWGNLHGGVIMGVMATGLYGVAAVALGHYRQGVQHALAALGILVALAVANPYGLEYMGFLVHAWTLDRSAITEWRPLLAGRVHAGMVFAALVAAAAVAHASIGLVRAWPLRFAGANAARAAGRSLGSSPAVHPGREVVAPALVLLLLVAMTLLALRIQTFLVLTLCAYLPALYSAPQLGALGAWLERRFESPGRWLGAWLPAAACAASVSMLLFALQSRPLLASIVPDGREAGPRGFAYPVAAVRTLQGSPFSGRLLNPFSSGQFLYWNLYPKFRVSMDGRYEEVYSPEQFASISRFFKEHRPLQPRLLTAFVDQSGVDFVLFRSVWRNYPALADSVAFREIQDDGVHALVGRVRTLQQAPGFTPTPRGDAAPTIGDFFGESSDGRFADYP